ncbi:uncharacterized protein ARB_06605 [Trichophyton benhamiae CBS 112371]|uniref:Uncharacterized protein n=1 Tax=Arthroderma benhamiae (strain ATCC MYA-4681 / CBS 112371) TaxID=663331 RepID=D4AQU5_ARTBC|nr:uncharacterized protein ARB_06605 [Trichophyton benhamiae CBS 112371]EFE34839.1 hypothetical protein ARB_06605 [Trichophyton benhamiae CBS 112371]
MPGAINWEPPASQASSNIMGMMMLKKRKRDAESRQETTVVPSTLFNRPCLLSSGPDLTSIQTTHKTLDITFEEKTTGTEDRAV